MEVLLACSLDMSAPFFIHTYLCIYSRNNPSIKASSLLPT